MKSLRLRAVVAGAVLTAVLVVTGSAQTDAAALYKTKCQVCHGADGKGDTPMGKKLGAKDFHAPEAAKMPDAELFDITKKGKNKMPAYGTKLTDDQIKGLIKYIRTLK